MMHDRQSCICEAGVEAQTHLLFQSLAMGCEKVLMFVQQVDVLQVELGTALHGECIDGL